MRGLNLISIIFLTALAAWAMCPSAAGAAEGSCAGRIGYVDFNRALNSVSDGVAAKAQLKNEFREKQQRLDILQKELTTMQGELDRERLTLSSDELESREKAYRQKFMEVQSRYADFRREMEDREASITEDILQRLRDIVKRIGESEGYSMVLEKSQDVVIYAPKTEDITEKVVAEYNSKGSGRKGR